MNIEELKIQIKTFYGLEEILAAEVKKLGGKDIEIKTRAVNCTGDLGFLYKINYSLRTALKILVPITDFFANNVDFFYHKLLKFDWSQYMDVDDSFAIDATIHSEHFTHSQYILLKMKDAIVDYHRKKYGKRPNIDPETPKIKFHLHIDRDMVSISLDSSGDPLYKRGYKLQHGTAPINEVLASGMLQMAGWDGKGNFLDPMCGSGTLLIEAGMIAIDLPAQIFRKNFAFQNWKNYDEFLFNKIKEVRIEKIREFNGKIIGYDIDPQMLEYATNNVSKAEMQDIIELKEQSFFESKKEHFPLLMVFNPPYNERISINEEEEEFYKKIGNTFKQFYPNTTAWFITSNLDAVKHIGLRPSRKIKLYNGKLETRFLQYVMYEGSKKTKYNPSL